VRPLLGRTREPLPSRSRHDEQMILVDEPGPDRVRGEGRTTYRDIEGRSSLQLANRLRVEFPLETRLRSSDGLQRFGIDALPLPQRGLVHRLAGGGGGLTGRGGKTRVVERRCVESQPHKKMCRWQGLQMGPRSDGPRKTKRALFRFVRESSNASIEP
jgi:hypothetical protein